MIQVEYIRNFCIIAHIDHGKSTLADRFLQKAKIIEERLFHEQMLDSMDIEQERGITIKSQAVHFTHQFENEMFYFNLVDTPGHVDFSYEVSRAISSCEGAILLVDATQGVEAQTLSNFYIALEHELTIIPVINKIDLPAADIDMVSNQIEHELGLDKSNIIAISAKQGIGIDALFDSIPTQIPAPKGSNRKPLKAQVFDSHYNAYLGVILHVRIVEGSIKVGDTIISMVSKAEYKIETVGHFVIHMHQTKELFTGEIGFISANIKKISDVRVGDTITDALDPCDAPLAGYKEVQPYVFSSVFPIDSQDLEELEKSIEKLSLNDASLVFEKDSSAALGTGFRCGYLGLLHLEIIQERLEREFGLSIIQTIPTVKYKIDTKEGSNIEVSQPEYFPKQENIAQCYEPYIIAKIICPNEYIGNVLSLCSEKRGIQNQLNYLDKRRIEVEYSIPLAEILYEFYDLLKSASKGYASFDYELSGYKPVQLAKLDIQLNGEKVDAFSQLIYKGNAERRARIICKKLKEEIPRHQFQVAIQGVIGAKVVARETISAYRKDVTAKCYGGDITRKRKLLQKQKEGKKRLKSVGNVDLPQRIFLSVLKSGDNKTK